MRICLANLHFLFNFELRSKILMLEKTQKKFGFLLAYSYLCSR